MHSNILKQSSGFVECNYFEYWSYHYYLYEFYKAFCLAFINKKTLDNASKSGLTKETHGYYLIDLNMILLKFIIMNIYLFWILFLSLWAIVPLMIIKGRVDEAPKIQTSLKVKAKKKGWFN